MASEPEISFNCPGRIALAIVTILPVVVILSCGIDDPIGIKQHARRTERAANRSVMAQYVSTSNALATLHAELQFAQTQEAAFLTTQAGPQSPTAQDSWDGHLSPTRTATSTG